MRRAHIIAIVSAVILIVAVLLGVNALIVASETKGAHPDVGFIVRLGHGDNLQVREDGARSRPAIVLLHGFDGSLRWWDAITPILSPRYRVIRFDLLGHGGSSKPSGGYSMEHQAQLVDEALGRIGVHRALIVGHSMGGLVATALAARDRRLAAGIALIDSPPNASAGQLPFIARLGFVPLIGEATRTLATNGMVSNGLASAFAPGYKVPRRFVADFWRMTYTSYASSHDQDRRYLQRESLTRRLTALRVPLLVIYGTRDQIIAPTAMRDFTSVPSAQIVPIAAAGHSPMVERPFAISRLLLSFAAQALKHRRT
jgi:pimeloyl-ACP methyl ester carboxylesterase